MTPENRNSSLLGNGSVKSSRRDERASNKRRTAVSKQRTCKQAVLEAVIQNHENEHVRGIGQGEET
jgi:hypothetical protein